MRSRSDFEKFGLYGSNDSSGDLVLQSNKIRDVVVEPLGPQMRVGAGVD